MALTGLTGDPIFRRKEGGGFQIDLGVTEALQSFLSPEKAFASSGGSQLFGSEPTQTQTPTSTGPGGAFPIAGGFQGTTQPTGGGTPAPPPPSGDAGAPSGPSDADIMSEINKQFEEQISFLNQARSALQADLPKALQEAESQFGVSKAQLEAGQAGALGKVGEQEVQAGERRVDALTAARRLFNELQQRQQQQFGGANSAGQAFGEIASREQQRRAGDIQRQFGTAQRQIESSRLQIDQQFNADLLGLQQQKQSAVNQVNRDFQNKLLEINRLRAEAGTNKAQLRLQALQGLRNQVFQIELQNRQFEQALEAQRQANQLGLSQSTQALAGFTGLGQEAVTGFEQGTTTSPQTAFLPSVPGRQAGPTPLTGQIARRREDEQLPIGQITPRRPEDFLG